MVQRLHSVLPVECHAKALFMSPSAAATTRVHRQCHEMQLIAHQNPMDIRASVEWFGCPRDARWIACQKDRSIIKAKNHECPNHRFPRSLHCSYWIAVHIYACKNYAETISARPSTIFLSESCCFFCRGKGKKGSPKNWLSPELKFNSCKLLRCLEAANKGLLEQIRC